MRKAQLKAADGARGGKSQHSSSSRGRFEDRRSRHTAEDECANPSQLSWYNGDLPSHQSQHRLSSLVTIISSTATLM